MTGTDTPADEQTSPGSDTPPSGDDDSPTSAPDADTDREGYAGSVDCDDEDAAVSPAAAEVCDGVDNDCDEAVDEGARTRFYPDADGDGFGVPEESLEDCSAPGGYSPYATDCDDADPSIYPGAEEFCDGRDTDCDPGRHGQTVAIAAGAFHTLVLCSDGTVWAAGDNYLGQLGDGTSEDIRAAPVRVNGLEDVVAVSGGSGHALALRSDGSVWAWGYNENGELGDGTREDRHTPVRVVGLEEVVAITAGGYHSMALRADGTVWAWGLNEYGQLGDGSTDDRSTPEQVVGIDQVMAISTGNFHSMALSANGTAWGWGSNRDGQLGNGFDEDASLPVAVSDLEAPAAISAGTEHSIALSSDGPVVAWGS